MRPASCWLQSSSSNCSKQKGQPDDGSIYIHQLQPNGLYGPPKHHMIDKRRRIIYLLLWKKLLQRSRFKVGSIQLADGKKTSSQLAVCRASIFHWAKSEEIFHRHVTLSDYLIILLLAMRGLLGEVALYILNRDLNNFVSQEFHPFGCVNDNSIVCLHVRNKKTIYITSWKLSYFFIPPTSSPRRRGSRKTSNIPRFPLTTCGNDSRGSWKWVVITYLNNILAGRKKLPDKGVAEEELLWKLIWF